MKLVQADRSSVKYLCITFLNKYILCEVQTDNGNGASSFVLIIKVTNSIVKLYHIGISTLQCNVSDRYCRSNGIVNRGWRFGILFCKQISCNIHNLWCVFFMILIKKETIPIITSRGNRYRIITWMLIIFIEAKCQVYNVTHLISYGHGGCIVHILQLVFDKYSQGNDICRCTKVGSFLHIYVENFRCSCNERRR